MTDTLLKSQQPRVRFIHLLWLLVVLLSLYEIERNAIYRFFIRGEKYIFSMDVDRINVAVSLPYKLEATDDWTPENTTVAQEPRYRVLKLSFPFGTVVPSCDQLFGVAVYNFSKTDELSALRRILFSFAYDVPNGRCEAKQLFLDDLGTPETIDLQFVKIDSGEGRLSEEPMAKGIRLNLNGQAFDPRAIEMKTRDISPQFPFLSPQRTIIKESFSSDPSPRGLKVLMSPRDDLEAELVSSLESFINECPAGDKCGPLRVAVARIDDPRFVDLFQRARDHGIDTEVLVSFRSWLGRADFLEPQPVNRLAPLEWLNSNPYVPYRPGRRLPMHTKFLILGERAVFSGSNLYFTRFPYARQNLIEYTDQNIVGMFHEVFTRIKSAAFEPKRIDLDRGFSLMIGGEEMQRIAAMRKRVSPGVVTEHGLKTTAYATALHLIDQAKRTLSVSMSPLSDGCHRFDKSLCFYDVLTEKVKSIKTTFYENPSFFADQSLQNQLESQLLPGQMSEDALPQFRDYAQRFRLRPEALVTPKLAFGLGGTIHHRMAIVDGETIIGGSVNLAHDLTLNTVEIIRSPIVAGATQAELDPIEEPYFIAPIRSDLLIYEMRNFLRDENCLFVYEFPTFSVRGPFTERSYSREQIATALASQYPHVRLPSDAAVVMPEWSSSSLSNPAEFPLVSKQISDGVSSASSYLCVVIPGSPERLIVKMSAG